mmetsp:Transcript_27964/g.64771  ORF Transcript_27964/g.64771 Transcript_27964/m.64771 type:complete len:391 (-) Transcript_27964:653-1825(-)
MSRAILQSGYGIASITKTGPIFLSNARSACQTTDVWYRHEMYRTYNNTIPSLDQLGFFKSSRFVPDAIAQEIGYTQPTQVFAEERSFWNEELIEEAKGGNTIMKYMRIQGKINQRIPSNVLVVCTVERCHWDAKWLGRYFREVPIQGFVIYDFCDKTRPTTANDMKNKSVAPLEAPPGATVIQSDIRRFASVYARLLREYAEAPPGSTNRMVFFVRSGRSHVKAWPAYGVLQAADIRGFACKRRPLCSKEFRKIYLPTVIYRREEWASYITPWGDIMPTKNLGYWVDNVLKVNVSSDLVPVCLGGSFAFSTQSVKRQSLETWRQLEKSLQEGQDYRDYADHAWAVLLSVPLAPEKVTDMLSRTRCIGGVNDCTNVTKGINGMLLWDLSTA